MRKTTAAAIAIGTALHAVAPVVPAISLGARPAPPKAMALASTTRETTLIGSLSRDEVTKYLAAYQLGSGKYAVDLYRVTYRTRGADGRRTTASTLVATPRTHRRLSTVLWLHGTRANRADTASVSDNQDRAAAVRFATDGHPTVAPDYIGLGVGPGTHPYMQSRPTVSASLDALRAARRVTPLSHRVLVTGFSQGGQAAMLVGRALRTDRHFRLAALAPINGPHDIRGAELPAALDGRLDDRSATFYLAYSMVSWNRRYHLWNDPAEAFRPRYAKKIEWLFDNNKSEGEIFEALPRTPAQLFTREFLARLTNPTGKLAWVLAREDTTCHDWHTSVPVRMYTASGDRDVAMANTLNCRDMLAEHGTHAEVIDLGDLDHFTSGRIAVTKVADWFLEIGRAVRGQSGPPPPPPWRTVTTTARSSLDTGLPPSLLTVPATASRSLTKSKPASRPKPSAPSMATSGLPLKEPSSASGRLCRLPARAVTTQIESKVDAQPATPGRSGQLHAGASSGLPGSKWYSRSAVGPWSVTHSREPSIEPHTPPGAYRPSAMIRFGVGLSAAGWPDASSRNTLPASERGFFASAGLPALPVASSSAPRWSSPSAPALPRGPRGMPVSTGLGLSPGAMRSNLLSVAVVT